MSGRDLVYTYGSIITAFVALKLIHILFIAGGVCHSGASLEGKTAIVTGANTGELRGMCVLGENFLLFSSIVLPAI